MTFVKRWEDECAKSLARSRARRATPRPFLERYDSLIGGVLLALILAAFLIIIAAFAIHERPWTWFDGKP